MGDQLEADAEASVGKNDSAIGWLGGDLDGFGLVWGIGCGGGHEGDGLG